MKITRFGFAFVILAACSSGVIAQTSDSRASANDSAKSTGSLDADREKQAFGVFLKDIQHQIVATAEAMPATKYEFTPTEGEFKGVRTFARQVRHLSATNHILAAAALGEEASADIDENGPETVRTKEEVLAYLNSSFEHLGKAIDAIGDPNTKAKASPISPLQATKTTR